MRPTRSSLATIVAGLGLLLGAFSPLAQASEAVADALKRDAIQVRNPQAAFMIGAAKAGATLVTVGERGLILLSEDGGERWRQADVPVSTGLTAVRFVDARHGMAVGHGGVVLGSSDGGESWRLLLDGRKAAELALAAAQRGDDDRAVMEAQRLVEEGPDKPFLDVVLTDPNHAVVVGAYGLAFETADGGRSWTPIMDRMANPNLLHFYSIRRQGSRMVVVGERGLVNLSDDGGKTFRAIETPYSGSFFTVELPSSHSIVAAGLKGNVWRSDDNGDQWSSVQSPIEASVTASRVTSSGSILLGNQAGMVLSLDNTRLTPVTQKRFPPINTFMVENDGIVVMTAEGIRLARTSRQ
ncbi:WD40/YVTN/BNR-like repeat-containing protein [Marinobacter bohaiensis]|uniref:WD40/YVTN/BNR-like repeat-containing protein n=1 Tax=Marinobacter bohaiensis TaxID=2201898 RepID=UPI000DACEC9B|nr:YCF48-related protein [Marinobacter bohaiensis]